MIFDYVLVGGGLQNGLIALALQAHRPAATIAMIERAPAPGGNHTWCFHAGDIDPGDAWIEPLIDIRWDGYDVAFPARQRTLAMPYACVTSRRFAEVVSASLARPGCRLIANTVATTVERDRVVYDGGELAARVVVDARGPGVATDCGWQKFVGCELALDAPHGLERPMLMDATVAQHDGFRFVYVLPLARDRLLVEDTYFSDGPELDVGLLYERIVAYATARGWKIAGVLREETGVLPLPWRAEPPVAGTPLRAGYAGGWFHPVTGYSFPIAARLAGTLARGGDLDALATETAAQQAFALRLNRMLFHWFAPHERYRVLEHFYRLPEPTIARFYALALTQFDRARIFLGRPPRGLSLRAVFGGEAR